MPRYHQEGCETTLEVGEFADIGWSLIYVAYDQVLQFTRFFHENTPNFP